MVKKKIERLPNRVCYLRSKGRRHWATGDTKYDVLKKLKRQHPKKFKNRTIKSLVCKR